MVGWDFWSLWSCLHEISPGIEKKSSATIKNTTFFTTRPCDELWLVEGCLHMDLPSLLHQPQLIMWRVVALIVPFVVALEVLRDWWVFISSLKDSFIIIFIYEEHCGFSFKFCVFSISFMVKGEPFSKFSEFSSKMNLFKFGPPPLMRRGLLVLKCFFNINIKKSLDSFL